MGEMATAPALPAATRRERFRRFIQAFNPRLSALEVSQRGWIIEDLRQRVYKNLAARSVLEPGSQQLLVGGNGSGKSTELLLVLHELRTEPEIFPVFAEVNIDTDPPRLQPGALLASFGLRLLQDFSSDLQDPKIANRIREFAHGRRVWVGKDDEEGGETGYGEDSQQGKDEGAWRFAPGKLNPIAAELQPDIGRFASFLQGILAKLPPQYVLVAIFDGLDRALTADRIAAILHQDLEAFRRLKISTIVTGPLSLWYSGGRTVTERFDWTQALAPLALHGDGLKKLPALVRRRDPDGLLGPVMVDQICRFSGGVLHDVVVLARDSAESAYVSSRDAITRDDVEEAARRLGDAYLRGIGADQRRALREIEKTGVARVDFPLHAELLAGRRVLEYSPSDFRLHPALKLVLETPSFS